MPSLNLKELENNFPWFKTQGILPFGAVTFFGGSFNPWHEGHSECIKSYSGSAPLIVVPDYNPQKDLIKHQSLEDFYQKILTDSGLKSSQVYPGMLLKQAKNPTYYWIHEMKQRHPELQINLLIGADSFKNLSTWIEVKKLLSLLHTLYVVPRMENENTMLEASAFVQKMAPSLNLEILPNHAFEHVSSTKIRQKNSLP